MCLDYLSTETGEAYSNTEQGQGDCPQDREKWEKVLALELLSSEDAGMDEDEEVLVVRPLPWRSTRVDKMFIQIFIIFWLLVLLVVALCIALLFIL